MDAEARRRWLAQQAELGGKDVLLSAPLASGQEIPRFASPAAETPAAPAAPRAAAERPESQPAKVAAPAPAGAAIPRWKKDLPPIPGPGLVRTLPVGDILGGDLGQLETLEAVAERIAGCRLCDLCDKRTRTVPGEGNPAARLLCVGEGPGEQEDLSGRPFVGKAGQLLDEILKSIETPRETVYIANVVKCRPPQNRKPLPDEMAACLPYLHRQIALLKPKVILALGATAAEGLLGQKTSLGEMRNKVHTLDGIPLVVTYHPAALLRNPNWKKPTWDDVRIARQLLDA